MLLIEIEGSTPRYHLEFHPRLTVVSDVSNAMREHLVESFRSILFGNIADNVLSVDVGGVPQLLTGELLQQLGLPGKQIGNVISAADLPGARVIDDVPTYSEVVEQNESNERASVFGRAHRSLFGQENDSDLIAPSMRAGTLDADALSEAERELASGEQMLSDLLSRLEDAKNGRLTTIPPELENARNAVDVCADRVKQLEARHRDLQRLREQAMPTLESKTVRIMRLRQIQEAVNERIFQLRENMPPAAADATEIEALLPVARQFVVRPDADAELQQFEDIAARYARDVEEVDRLTSLPRPPAWLVDQTQEQIAEAQARITAFSYQIKEGIDVRRQLAKARERLLEAQEAWETLENGVEGELRVARRNLEESTESVRALLQLPLGVGVANALRAERERLQNTVDPRTDLVAALARRGAEASADSAVMVAERWLSFRSNQQSAHEQAQSRLVDTLADLEEVEAQILEIAEEPDVDAAEQAPTEEMIEVSTALRQALQARSAAEAALVAINRTYRPIDMAEEIAILEAEVEEAATHVEAAESKVRYFSNIEALRNEEAAADEDLGTFDPGAPASEEANNRFRKGRPWWDEIRTEPKAALSPIHDPRPAIQKVDVSGVDEHEVELFVLATAANMRRVANGDSVPLVIDGAFDDLDPSFVSHLLDALAAASEVVQVVYLSSGKPAQRWVRDQDIMVAAPVVVEDR